MRYFLGLTLAAALLASCKGNTGSTSATTNTATTATAKTAPPPAPKSDLSQLSQAAFLDMMKPYYELKEALVAANAAQADAAASRLLSAAEETRQTIMTNDTRLAKGFENLVMDSMAAILNSTEALINVKDDTVCSKKRVFFEKISDQIFAVGSAVHLKNSGAYRQFCPMAFNDKGAYWLSDNPDIRNPYFGKKMLECGETRDSL